MKAEESESMQDKEALEPESPSEKAPEAPTPAGASSRRTLKAGGDAMRIYEGMFLVEPSKGRRKEDETVDDITALIVKHGGKIINGAQWADRELAYPIHKNHQKYTRAVYFLFHFSAPPEAISHLEREVNLADWLLRALIIKDEDGVELPGVEKAAAAEGTES